MNKMHSFAQAFGYVCMVLLAIYGLLTLLGGKGWGFTAPEAARAQANSPYAISEIPGTFNYQGFLRNPDGSLVTGVHTITAQIYDLATGGAMLYTETFPNVTVRDGLFNIVLGDNPGGYDLKSVFRAYPNN